MRSPFAAGDEQVRRRFAAREPELDDRWRAKAFIVSLDGVLTPEDADELGRRSSSWRSSVAAALPLGHGGRW